MTTAYVIDEALAIERAGGTWTFAHAAAVTGYSVSALRHSDCPRKHERTPKGITKDRVVFIPAEVRAWKASLLIERSA